MADINPFDAADLENFIETRHILRGYAKLSLAMKQRWVDTIVNDANVVIFIDRAGEHLEHDPDKDFDLAALDDLAKRMQQNLVQSERRMYNDQANMVNRKRYTASQGRTDVSDQFRR